MSLDLDLRPILLKVCLMGLAALQTGCATTSSSPETIRARLDRMELRAASIVNQFERVRAYTVLADVWSQIDRRRQIRAMAQAEIELSNFNVPANLPPEAARLVSSSSTKMDFTLVPYAYAAVAAGFVVIDPDRSRRLLVEAEERIVGIQLTKRPAIYFAILSVSTKIDAAFAIRNISHDGHEIQLLLTSLCTDPVGGDSERIRAVACPKLVEPYKSTAEFVMRTARTGTSQVPDSREVHAAYELARRALSQTPNSDLLLTLEWAMMIHQLETKDGALVEYIRRAKAAILGGMRAYNIAGMAAEIQKHDTRLAAPLFLEAHQMAQSLADPIDRADVYMAIAEGKLSSDRSASRAAHLSAEQILDATLKNPILTHQSASPIALEARIVKYLLLN